MTDFKLLFTKVNPEMPNSYDGIILKWKGEDGVTYGEVYGMCREYDLMDLQAAIKQMAKDIKKNFHANGNKKE